MIFAFPRLLTSILATSCWVLAMPANAAPSVLGKQEALSHAQRIRAAQEVAVDKYEQVYSGPSIDNPDGKSFREWDAADLSRLETLTLTVIRAIFVEEYYDLVDRIRPDGMSRSEFSRNVLRELGRRDETIYYYERRLPFTVASVEVSRPQDAAPGSTSAIRERPAFVTGRDTAIAILGNRNTGAVRVQPDVARQAGLDRDPGLVADFGIQTDTSAYDLGYTMGSVPQNRAGGSTPLSLLFDRTPEEIRWAYCVVTNGIYAERGRQIDQREAFAAGFAQARQDAQTGFRPDEARIGVLDSVCPDTTPPVDDNARLMLALRSWTDMGVTRTIPAA